MREFDPRGSGDPLTVDSRPKLAGMTLLEGMIKGVVFVKRERGFTLAELLMVVVIVGILTAIGVPNFYPAVEKGRVSEAIAVLSALRQAEKLYNMEHSGSWVTSLDTEADWNQIRLEMPSSSYFTYTFAACGTSHCATATRNNVGTSVGASGTDKYKDKLIRLRVDGKYCTVSDHPLIPPTLLAGAADCSA